MTTSQSPTVRDVLATLTAGDVQLATSASVGDVLAELASFSPVELSGRRLIVFAWDQLPEHTLILKEALDHLATAALALWPEWYATGPVSVKEQPSLALLLERVTQSGLERSVLPNWLKNADAACRTKRAPRWAHEFTGEVEARQLALAIGERACPLVLAVRDEQQDNTALLGLARVSEWLARETKMPLLVLVPSALGQSHELDSINFARVELACEVTLDESLVYETDDVTTQRKAPEPRTQRVKPPRRSRVFVHPLIGRPHPDSAGEQLLWEKLQSDAELAGLFLCNQWTSTNGNSTYLVDFVWATGKLVVEVDGYYWHSSQQQFSLDRRRDYEMMLTGHLVLRLPHDDVIADVGEAIEKVRRMVRMRQQQGK